VRKTLFGCLALLGEDARPSDGPVDIVIDGGFIHDIRPSGATPAEGDPIDLRGKLVTAGIVNGHHHSHEGFFKGRDDVLPLELWMRALKPIALSPRDVYLRTMIGAIEAVRSGTTTLGDDANVGAVVDPNHVEAVFQAYDDIGIRAYVGVTLFDKPFIHAVPFVEEEVTADMVRELETMPMMRSGERLDLARQLARTRHPERHRVAYMVCPSAPQRCTESFLREVRALADEFDLPVMMHVQETRMQVVTGRLWWGTTMIEYLDRIGFLKPQTQLIHAIWLNPREIDILAASGVTVQHNPASALRSGSGLAPVRALLEAGVNVSLGTDGCGSIEGTDMQNVLYLVPLLQRLRDHKRNWISAREAFLAATLGGAKAFGRRKDLGAVDKGRVADLVAFNLDEPAFTPLNNPINQLVYSGRKTIDLVMVDGEVILANGRLTRIDEDQIVDEIRAAHARLAPLLLEAEKDGDRFHAPFERIYRRCNDVQIASDTYPARLSH